MRLQIRFASSLVVIAVALGLCACGGSTSVNSGVLPEVTSRASVAAGMTCVRHCVSAEYPLPDPGSGAVQITSGVDGNLWFPEFNANKIGRISATGVITTFAIPTKNAGAYGITNGPNGNLWFTETVGLKVGRITTSGVIREFDVPPGFPCNWPVTCGEYLHDIGRGPGGRVWFDDISWRCFKQHCTDSTRFDQVSSGGISIGWTDVFPSTAGGFTVGPDGNLWFTDVGASAVGRMTPAGDVTEFPTPTADSSPDGIVKGADGSLWFTEFNADKIGKITTSGVITEFAIPTPNSQPNGITSLQHGGIWFTELAANQIGKITTSGIVSEYSIPTPSSFPEDITPGPDGNLWFVENMGNKIAKFIP